MYNVIRIVERTCPSRRHFTDGITRSVSGTLGKPNLRFPRILRRLSSPFLAM